jgi:hypothetical protein
MLTLLVVLLLAAPAVACNKGCAPYQGDLDLCVCDQAPERSDNTPTADPLVVSDEKPSRHPESAYLRGEVIAATPPSCAATNDCSDQKEIDAAAQGKKAAGVK